MAANIEIVVGESDFDVGRVYANVREDCGTNLGAVAIFAGLVRDRNEIAGDGDTVATLTLEHYPGMTERSIHNIVEQADERWSLLSVHVQHRVGTLAPLEQIVLVAVGARHRTDAFAAAEYIMDYLKTDAVLWKREVTAGGERWLEATTHDHERTREWRE